MTRDEIYANLKEKRRAAMARTASTPAKHNGTQEQIKKNILKNAQKSRLRGYDTDLRSLSDRLIAANEWQDADTMGTLARDLNSMIKRTKAISDYDRTNGGSMAGIDDVLTELEKSQKGVMQNALTYSAYRDADNWRQVTDRYRQDYETYGGKLPSEIQRIAEKKNAERDSRLSSEISSLEEEKQKLEDFIATLDLAMKSETSNFERRNKLAQESIAKNEELENLKAELEEKKTQYKSKDEGAQYYYYDAIRNTDWFGDASMDTTEDFKRNIIGLIGNRVYQGDYDEINSDLSDLKGEALDEQFRKAQNLLKEKYYSGEEFKDVREGFAFLDDDQKKMVNALWNTFGQEAAQEYYDYLYSATGHYDTSLAAEIGRMVADRKNNGFERVVSAYGMGLAEWKEGYARAFSDTVRPTTVSEYQAAYMKDAMETGFGNLMYDLSQNLGNNAPSALAGILTGNLMGTALSGAMSAGKISAGTVKTVIGATKAATSVGAFGLPIYGNAYNEARKMGYTAEQAKTYGILNATFEVALENLIGGIPGAGKFLSGQAIEALGNKVSSTIGKIVLNLGGDMIGEFTEESLQEIIDVGLRNAIFGEHGDVDWGDVLYAGVLGGLSSLSMAGLEIIDTGSYRHKLAKEYEALFLDSNGSVKRSDIKALIDETLNAQEERSDAYILAQKLRKKIDKGKKILKSDYATLAELAQSNDAALIEKEKKRVGQSVAEDGNTILKLYGKAVDEFDFQSFGKSLIKEIEDKKSISLANAFLRSATPSQKTSKTTLHLEIGNQKYDAEVILERHGGVLKSKDGKQIVDVTGDVSIKSVENVYGNADFREKTVSSSVSSSAAPVKMEQEEIDRVNEMMSDVFAERSKEEGPGGEEEMVRLWHEENDDKAEDERQEPRYYAEQYMYIRTMASVGYDFKSIVQRGLVDGISKKQFEAAFLAGTKIKLAKDAARQKKVEEAIGKGDGQKKHSGKVFYSGTKVHYKGKEQVLNGVSLEIRKKPSADQKAAFDFAENVLAQAGVDVVFFDANVKNAPNGFYRNGVIYVNIRAGATNSVKETFVMYTVAHEMVHLCETYSPELYREYSDAVLETLSEKVGIDVAELAENYIAEYKGVGKKLTKEEALSEIVADASKEVFVNESDFAATIRKGNPGLWDKIKKFVKRAIYNVRRLYSGKKANGALAEAIRPYLDELAKKFTPMMTDALDARRSAGVLKDGNVSYSYGVTQEDINKYVENAKTKTNTESYKKYAKASDKLVTAVKEDIDISDYSHALRDNDIRHIINSHGTSKNEKYPVSLSDIESIPFIVENYDKVFYNNHRGNDSLIYVKVWEGGITYYVEQAIDKYGNEKLLINKQMIKTGIKDIPTEYRVAINKKEGFTKFLADLKQIHEEYAQSAVGNPSTNSISQNPEMSTDFSKKDQEISGTDAIPFEDDVRFSIGDGESDESIVVNKEEWLRELDGENAGTEKDAKARKRGRKRVLKTPQERMDALKANLGERNDFLLQDGKNIDVVNKVLLGELSPTSAGIAIKIASRSFATGQNKEVMITPDMVTAIAMSLDHKKTSAADTVPKITAEEAEVIVKEIVAEEEHELDKEDAKKQINEVSSRFLAVIDSLLENNVNNSRVFGVLSEYQQTALQQESDVKELEEVRRKIRSLVRRSTLNEKERAELRQLSARKEELIDKTAVQSNRISQLENSAVLRDLEVPIKKNKYKSRRRTEYEKAQKEIRRAVEVADRRVLWAKNKVTEAETRFVAKLTEAKKKIRENYKKYYNELLQKRDAYWKERNEKAKQTGRIARTMSRLYQKLVTPTKDSNIPEGLRKTVASLFEIVPMYKNFAQIDNLVDRLGKLHEKIGILEAENYTETQQDKRGNSLETLRRREAETVKNIRVLMGPLANMDWAERLEKLGSLVTEFSDYAQKGGLYASFAPGLAEQITEWVETLRQEAEQSGMDKKNGWYAEWGADFAKTLNFFGKSAKEIKDYADMLDSIAHTICEIRTLHDANRNMSLDETARGIMDDFDRIKTERKSGNAVRRAYDDMIRKAGVRNMTPTYYAEWTGKYGSETIGRLMDPFFGKNGFAERVKIVEDFRDKIKEEYHTDQWSGKNDRVFTEDGISMTAGEIMTLYAYSDMEQARGHILSELGGKGVAVDKTPLKDIMKEKDFRKVDSDVLAVKMSEETMNKLIGHLSEEQKKCVNELKKFMMEQLAEWGNETTMREWLYKGFTRKNYFPIRTVKGANDMDTTKINYFGTTPFFVKHTQKGANSAIRIGDIFGIFSQYATQMLRFACFKTAETDVQKIQSWRTEHEDGSLYGIKQTADHLFYNTEKDGKNYVEKLIETLEGTGVEADKTFGKFDWFMGAFKASAVTANFRVVIQQPTAIIRAAIYLKPGSLVYGMSQALAHPKRCMEEAQSRNTRAWWKHEKGYDMGLSRSFAETIKGEGSLREKCIEVFGKAAGFADDITWAAIYYACRSEISQMIESGKLSLKVNSEEYYEKVNELFDSVIDHTQVIDSPMHRSELMRSNNHLNRIMTNFGAEPTLYINILNNAIYRVSTGKMSKRSFTRTVLSLFFSSVVNVAAASVVSAGRDDDEGENYAEKYLQAFLGDLVGVENGSFSLTAFLNSEMNMLNKIPYLKDIFSIMDGYGGSSSGRADVAAMEQVRKAIADLLKTANGKGDFYQSAYSCAKAISLLTGVPVSNLMREVKAIFNTFQSFKNFAE